MNNVQVKFRHVLLSSGDLTPEVVMEYENFSIYESSPDGLTVGLKEKNRGISRLPEAFSFNFDSFHSQIIFDKGIAEKYDSVISTALSLAFMRLDAELSQQTKLHEYISKQYGSSKKLPKLIFNVLNGGKHAGNGLSFCEFMIIPKQEDPKCSIRVASEVYSDLRTEILFRYSDKDVLVGREGGFAPNINETGVAIDLILTAINRRNRGEVDIAIDAAANHFSSQKDGSFSYDIDEKSMSTRELFSFYKKLLLKHPSIKYIEDCFHENDLAGWSLMMNEFSHDIDIVADDLTVSTKKYAEEHQGLFNACVLKVNQVGNVTGLMETFKFCEKNNTRIIISQRSGETDSDFLSHLAIGLGADYMKAGAPARERITKYNSMIRILS